MGAPALDETHDPRRRSFVGSAQTEGCDFPIQNLPYGVFRERGGKAEFRVGVAIGDRILDVSRMAHLLSDASKPVAVACAADSLNPLMAQGRESWRWLRCDLSALLSDTQPGRVRDGVSAHLLPAADCDLALPVRVGDFTDFYASIFHATNAGRLIRPDNPLLPNYKYVPVAYHSRVSTLRPSGATVRRPHGQIRGEGATEPVYRPTARLDYEAELGIYIGAGSVMGEPIPIAAAGDHVFGYCLLNDWSARDIQVWEYQPLGPFLAKSFATIVSPWVVTELALQPYRVPAYRRPAGDPAPLPHLLDADDQRTGGLAVVIEASLLTGRMRDRGMVPHPLGRGTFAQIYWTVAQMIAHHSSNGCSLLAGDLVGSGTVSGDMADQWGSLLELSWGGTRPIALETGETRTFLEDGDEIILRGSCEAAGRARLGFGECRSRIAPALCLA